MKHAAEKHDALRARWRNAERQGTQTGTHAA